MEYFLPQVVALKVKRDAVDCLDVRRRYYIVGVDVRVLLYLSLSWLVQRLDCAAEHEVGEYSGFVEHVYRLLSRLCLHLAYVVRHGEVRDKNVRDILPPHLYLKALCGEEIWHVLVVDYGASHLDKNKIILASVRFFGGDRKST